MTHPAEASTFEDIEKQLAADEAAGQGSDVLQSKLDGDSIPDEYRGMTVSEIIKRAEATRDGLIKSEEVRKEIMTRLDAVEQRTSQPAAPAAPPEPEFTEDDFRKMYEDDPAGALLKWQERTEKQMTENFNSRFAPLVAGQAQGAEAQARERWGTEFELFGDQIDSFIKTNLGGNRQALASAQAWDDLIAYIRGKPQNVDMLFEHRSKQAEEAKRKDAESFAAAATPFSGTGVSRRPPSSQGSEGALDDLEREIAAGLGMSEAEYLKWKKVS